MKHKSPMTNGRLSILLLTVFLSWTGCSDDEGVIDIPADKAALTFHVTTRANENSEDAAITDRQFGHLLLAERKPEHSPIDGDERLHCDPAHRYDLEGSQFQIDSLLGQWYKFAFVCLPALPDTEMGKGMLIAEGNGVTYDTEHDFNKLMVNYMSALTYQENNLEEAQSEDLAIYRKVIDRWVDAVNPTSENVALTRMTGELVMDMGIPSDQFNTKEKGNVIAIEVTLPQPSLYLYIHDEANDEVITSRGVSTYRFVWNVDAGAQDTRQRFRVALLPGALDNGDTKATVTVSFENGEPEEFVLNNEDSEAIEIKKNTRTTVLFNGMHTDEFEVRYAGFDDRAFIDVADDGWYGW